MVNTIASLWQSVTYKLQEECAVKNTNTGTFGGMALKPCAWLEKHYMQS